MKKLLAVLVISLGFVLCSSPAQALDWLRLLTDSDSHDRRHVTYTYRYSPGPDYYGSYRYGYRRYDYGYDHRNRYGSRHDRYRDNSERGWYGRSYRYSH